MIPRRNHVAYDEWQHALEGLVHGHVLGHGVDDEDVEPEGRRDHPHLDRHQREDAEPYADLIGRQPRSSEATMG